MENTISPEDQFSPTEWEENVTEQLESTWNFIKQHQKEVADRMKNRYDKNRKALRFEPGDLVLLSTKSHRLLEGHRKHRQTKVGPYVIDRKIHENAYRLLGLPTGVPPTQNVQYLSHYRPSPHRFRDRPEQDANEPAYRDGVPECEVEIILAVRGAPYQRSFLVKWFWYSTKTVASAVMLS